MANIQNNWDVNTATENFISQNFIRPEDWFDLDNDFGGNCTRGKCTLSSSAMQ